MQVYLTYHHSYLLLQLHCNVLELFQVIQNNLLLSKPIFRKQQTNRLAQVFCRLDLIVILFSVFYPYSPLFHNVAFILIAIFLWTTSHIFTKLLPLDFLHIDFFLVYSLLALELISKLLLLMGLMLLISSSHFYQYHEVF